MQHLYIIGNQTTVNLFSLAGAKGLIVDSSESLRDAMAYLTENEASVGGLCLTVDISPFDAKALQKLRRLQFPVLELPSGSDTDGSGKNLELLMDQALGMKLTKGS
jgi:vacuolar-type H+-ATPase subunit F/Vma7